MAAKPPSVESETIPPGDLNFPLSQILNYSSHRRPRLSDFDFPHLWVAKKNHLQNVAISCLFLASSHMLTTPPFIMEGPKDWENPNSPVENNYIIDFTRGINLPWTATPTSEEHSEFDCSVRNNWEMPKN